MTLKDVKDFAKLHEALHGNPLLALDIEVADDKKLTEILKDLGIEVSAEANPDVDVKILGEIAYIKENKLTADNIRKRYTKVNNKEIAKALGLTVDPKAREAVIAEAIFNKLKDQY